MRTNNFTLLNKPGETTWFRGSQSSTLDLTWASNNSLNNISYWGIREDLHVGSDHLPITWTLTLNHNLIPPSLPKYRTEDDLSTPWSKTFTSLLMERWTFPDYISNEETFLEATNIFHECMIEASDLTLQPKPPKPKPSFWYNNLCRSGVRKVRDSKRQYKLDPSDTTLQELKTNTTKYKRTIRLSKKLGAAKFTNKVTRDNIWRLNSWYRGARRTYTPILIDGTTGDIRVYPEDKANLMHNAWFTPPQPIPGCFEFEGTNHNTRRFKPVTFREIEEILKSTSNTSAPGSTGIGYKILKWVLTAAPDEMTAIVKASIRIGTHHPRWKSSLVVVIPKAKKPSYSDPKAWRPIQLLDTLGKLIEKIMAKRIIYEIGRHNLTPLEQFGGCSNSSCYDAITSLTHDIQTAWKKNLIASFLVVDVKGFFDHIHHNRLIYVLWEKGFCTQTCKWVQSFVLERQAAIRLDDYVSTLKPINIGLAQGSPISPVLACLYALEPLE